MFLSLIIERLLRCARNDVTPHARKDVTRFYALSMTINQCLLSMMMNHVLRSQ